MNIRKEQIKVLLDEDNKRFIELLSRKTGKSQSKIVNDWCEEHIHQLINKATKKTAPVLHERVEDERTIESL